MSDNRNWNLPSISFPDFLDNLFDSAYIVDTNKKIVYWNKSAEILTGFDSNEVLGHCCSDNILTHIDSAGTGLCKTACPLSLTLKDFQPREAEVFLHHKNGMRIPVSIRISPIHNEHGEIVGAVEFFHDNNPKITLLQQIEELKELALIDPLTQLGNRRYIEMCLQTRLAELNRNDIPFGILFLDVDNFKRVNDTYGHDVGDRVLTIVAKTLLHNSRAMDIYGRLGGEELMGIIRINDGQQLHIQAERIRMLIENSYLIHQEKQIRVTVSIGATMAAKDDTLVSLITRADNLMYESKRTGKNRVTLK